MADNADRAALRFLDGGGAVAEAIRQRDWSDSPLGPPAGWPVALKVALGACIGSRFPMVVWWGPELLMLYNDAWRPILGEAKHRSGLGRPGAMSWPETWPIVGPQFERALAGEANWSEDQLLAANRRGFLEECYFTYSHSPLRDADGDIVGVLTTVTETTARVLAARRSQVLGELFRLGAVVQSRGIGIGEAAGQMLEALGRNDADVAFALLYLADRDGETLHLRASVGLDDHAPAPAARLSLSGEDPWGVAAACREARPIEKLADASLGELPGGAWPEPCREVLTLPVQDADGSEPPSGALVCGLSAGLKLDGPYRDYLRAASARIGAMVKSVRISRRERRRTDALTMLDAFGRQLIATRSPGELVEVLLDATMALHGADLGAVQLYDQQDPRLRIAAQRGCGRAFLDHFATTDADDGSACARALRSGATVVIEDVETDAGFAPHRAAAAAAGFRAVLSTPILNSETRDWVGAVSVHFRAPRSIPRSLIDFTEVHAKVAADLLVRRLAEQRLVESETQLLAAKEGLERRVAERTRDLESANRKLTLEIGQRSKAEEALRQMQRLEAVGQLTAGVAHDFNNLLTVVIGNVEFLSNRLTDTDALRRLAMVQASAERGAKLTAQLLAFSRQQQLSPRPVDINATVKSMRELLRGALRGAIGLKVSLARRPWAALADPTQIELVILNLAINARDAMPDGGELVIETRNVQVRRRSRRPGAPEPGDYAVVSVRDNGSGMAPEVLARAFEPFFTTKPVGQGSGLGLAQVYGFAVQSGGGLTIDSEPGRGTAVRVFLPRAVKDADSQPRAEPAIDDETDGRTILLVDDDALVRATEAEILASLGYRVVQAANGEAALKVLDRRADIDALVVDFGMPGMNGGEVARQALARRPGIPLLFVTGFADRAALSQVPDANILPKPFRRSELAAKLAGALSGQTAKFTATRGATGPGIPWPASAPEPN